MSGLGSFVKGAFDGYSFGENVKDKKAERERKKDRHEWDGAAQERASERHGWARGDNEWVGEQRGRQRETWEREDDTREAYADAYEATKDSYGEDGGRGVIEGDSQPVTISTSGDGPGAEPLVRPKSKPEHLNAPQPRSVMIEAPTAPRAPEAAPNVAPSVGTDGPAMQRTAPVQPVAPSMSERGVMDTAPAQAPAPRRPSRTEHASKFEAPAHVMRAAQEADKIEEMLESGTYEPGGPPLAEQDKAMFADLLAQRDAELMAWSQDDRPLNGGQFNTADERRDAFGNTGPRQAAEGTRATPASMAAPAMDPAPAMPAPDGPISRAAPGEVQPQQGWRAGPDPQAPRNPPAPPAQPQPGAAPGEATGAVPVERETIEELDDRAANAPIEEGGAPSVEVAEATLTKGVVGEGGAMKSTPARDKKATESFMDRYAKVGAPMVMEHYLKTGQPDKAKAFEEWLDTRETKQAMRSWSEGVRRAAVGDWDGVLDHLSETYNGVDDGYTVLRDKSAITKDSRGNVTGGYVTFKDSETGEEFVREFKDQSDIIELGIYALAPEQMFEYLYKIDQEARSTGKKLIEEREGKVKDYAGMIGDEMDSIRKAESEKYNPADRLTEDQIREQAELNVRRRLAIGEQHVTGGGKSEPPQDYRMN
jgi:hypothetical protein